MKLWRIGGFLLVMCVLAACTTARHSAEPESETLLPGRNVLPPAATAAALSGTVDFAAHVRPILQAKCVVCHEPAAQPKGIHLESRVAARRSGVFGLFIVPGQPERSLLVTKIEAAHTDVKSMPPVGESLTKDETAILNRWIRQGAAWPE